jgi:hypothetical protein
MRSCLGPHATGSLASCFVSRSPKYGRGDDMLLSQIWQGEGHAAANLQVAHVCTGVALLDGRTTGAFALPLAAYTSDSCSLSISVSHSPSLDYSLPYSPAARYQPATLSCSFLLQPSTAFSAGAPHCSRAGHCLSLLFRLRTDRQTDRQTGTAPS